MKIAKPNTLPDHLGIAFSGLCLVHCLALPLAVALLPVLASSGADELIEAEWFHAALLVPVVLVSGSVLGRRALTIQWLGPLLILALAAMTGALFVQEEWQEQALTIGGASVLLFAHWLNLRDHRRA